MEIRLIDCVKACFDTSARLLSLSLSPGANGRDRMKLGGGKPVPAACGPVEDFWEDGFVMVVLM